MTPNSAVEFMVRSVHLLEPKLSRHARWRWKEADTQGTAPPWLITSTVWNAVHTHTSSPELAQQMHTLILLSIRVLHAIAQCNPDFMTHTLIIWFLSEFWKVHCYLRFSVLCLGSALQTLQLTILQTTACETQVSICKLNVLWSFDFLPEGHCSLPMEGSGLKVMIPKRRCCWTVLW